jgi:hypothetical protein
MKIGNSSPDLVAFCFQREKLISVSQTVEHSSTIISDILSRWLQFWSLCSIGCLTKHFWSLCLIGRLTIFWSLSNQPNELKIKVGSLSLSTTSAWIFSSLKQPSFLVLTKKKSYVQQCLWTTNTYSYLKCF